MGDDTQTPRSPWLNATQAALYLGRGRRFILRQIKSGAIRGAVVGGRREVLTKAEWLDAWVAAGADKTAHDARVADYRPAVIGARRRS
jgi:excisionase family DNA binding protein